ncbi:MAG TPA: tetratricopeptide repeat protein [Thermoanaerobaculia bacterium]
MFRTRALIALSLGILAITAPAKPALAIGGASVQAAQDLERQIALAESLVAQKRLAEAEALLLAARPPARGSQHLELLLARIRLWQGRLHEAAADFRALIALDPANAAAREGLATALYWSGDWPAAAREYRQVLASDPQHENARTTLRDIERTAAGVVEAGVSLAEDDQPFRRAQGQVSFVPRAESLTRWRFDVGSALLESPDQGVSETAPFAAIHLSSSFPRSGFAVEVWTRARKFPDGEAMLLGGGAVRRSILSPHSRLSLSIDQRELLYTTTSLTTHPYVTAATLRWDLEQPSGWYASVNAEGLRYFDDNRGAVFDAWILRPLSPSLSLGASVGWRDTEESRFTPAGVYTPYYSPLNLREARVIVVLSRELQRGRIGLHLDTGYARETIKGSYHPFRGVATAAIPFGTNTLRLEIERSQTAFYSSNEIRASLARRF